MMLTFNNHELSQFQYILPAQGDIETLELVEKILNKINSNDIDFDKNEILLMKGSIHFLNQQKMITLSSLSLVKKILSLEE